MTRPLLVDPLSPHVNIAFKSKLQNRWINVSHRVTQANFTHTARRKTNKIDITFDNEDLDLFTWPGLMSKGTRMRMTFGYPGQIHNAGEFAIKTHSGDRRRLSVSAHGAKRSKMNRRAESRVFENMKDSEVVTVILAQHGFNGFIGEPSTVVHAQIAQTRETDWHFLERLAKKNHRDFYLDQKGAHWEEPRRRARAARVFRYVKNNVGAGDITDWSFDSLAGNVPGRVVFRGRDPLTGKDFEYTADDSTTNIVRLTDSDDITDPDTGDRETGGTEGREIVRNVGAENFDTAKLLADALYKSIRYAVAKLRLTVIGDPTLRARTVVLVNGIGPAIDGAYWLKEVTHRFGGMYTCDMDLDKDGLKKLGKKASRGSRSVKPLSLLGSESYREDLDPFIVVSK